MEGTYINIKKLMYDEPIVSRIVNGKKFKVVPLQKGTR